MYFTVSELSRAVKKSENYVRQHINRNHLNVLRDGRSVLVHVDEATRWARERELLLELPAHFSVPTSYSENRVGRITVLTWHSEGANPTNLFTLIRHRSRDALGPWASEPDETWSSEEVLSDCSSDGEAFQLHVMDAPLGHCQDLVDRILDKGKLDINGIEVDYHLEDRPRVHWAYRDERPNTAQSFRSPFSEHSAQVTEYWSFAEGPCDRWMTIAESSENNLEPLLKKIGFPLLGRRPDRIGNLLLAGAEDTLYCNLSALNQENALILSVERVDGGELTPDDYTATLWASHSGDDVLRREVPVTRRETVIDLRSEVDRIGFAIRRNVDGVCFDFMDTHLAMSISIEMNIGSGTDIQLRDRKRPGTERFSLPSARSMINVEADRNSAALDKQIRREYLDRNSFERTLKARRERNFGRFGPDQFAAAAKFFRGLLSRHLHTDEPIYLADPYFTLSRPKEAERKFYLRMFEVTSGHPLRILCSPKTDTPIEPWWSGYPDFLTRHITVRELIKQSGHGRTFHDRYLIAGDEEILISHSFSGWRTDGVTLVSLPYGVYRAEAEKWWSMGPGVTPEGILVREVN